MKRLFLALLALCCTGMAAVAQSVVPGHAYYIVNDYYDKAVSYGSTASAASLSTPGTNPDESYVFDCIASVSKPDFVYLRQRSTGLWLAATNENSWGMVLTTEKNYYGAWNVGGGRLSNYHAQSKYLGVDTGGENLKYVGFYYDKGLNERSLWHFVEATGSDYAVSLEAQKLLEEAAVATSKGAEFVLSGDSLNLGRSYTLSLDCLRFRNATDSATVVLRNRTGMGLMVDIARGYVKVGDSKFTYPELTTEISLRFECNADEMAIYYKEDSLLCTVPTEALGIVTTVGCVSEWTLLRSNSLTSYMPVMYSRDKVLKPGEYDTDKLGHKVAYIVCMRNARTGQVPDGVDMHVLRASPWNGSCRLNLQGERSRLIFDNTKPSVVNSNISSLTVNGSSASTRGRVAIYLNGTVVFAKPKVLFTGYTGEQYTGDEIALSATGNINLKDDANEMRSFILRRGYMATLASGPDQEGYTRVYVADHEDLLVPVLPDALNRRVSSVHIKPWQYVSKKGWCSTKGNSTIASDMKKLGATWFYTWSADRSTTADAEYIPIRQHIWWPSVSQIGGHANSTACLMMNEPEHSEQHDKCDCGGVISEWTACTKTPEMGRLGMRVGSPAPTDEGWPGRYIGHVDDMAYRCDFVAIHCYWGTNEAANAQKWKEKLTAIYNATKRPIWITEWNNGANWTSESWPSSTADKYERQRQAIKEIVAMLESLDFVERYAIYNDVEWFRYVLYDDGGLTPAGREYRDAPSTFAYNAKVQKVPNWWAPDLKAISVSAARHHDGTATLTIKNPNGDMTDELWVEQLQDECTWAEVARVEGRHQFDAETQTLTLDMDEACAYRVQLTTVRGKSATVNLPALMWNEDKTLADATSYITNADCGNGTSGWETTEVETNKGEASDGVPGNVYWNIWKPDPYTSTMKQTLENMPRGYYTLSAQLRGQEHVVLSLAIKGDSKTARKSFKGTGTTPKAGSPYPMGWQDVTTAEVLCLDGTLEISLKATNGSGAGWWSADNFKLTYRPDPTDGIEENRISDASDGVEYDLSGRPAAAGQRGVVISGGRKIVRQKIHSF